MGQMRLNQQRCSKKADGSKGGIHDDFMRAIVMPVQIGVTAKRGSIV